jgi:hypothetical protein
MSTYVSTLCPHDPLHSAISEADSTPHDPGTCPAAFHAITFALMRALSERAHTNNSLLAQHMIEQQQMKKPNCHRTSTWRMPLL